MDLTPAHKLAASRLFLTKEDVDDITELVINSSYIKDLTVWDLGAGSGTTAMSVLQTVPWTRVITVDIEKENIYWARINLDAFEIGRTNWEYFVGSTVSAAEFCKKYGYNTNIVLHDASHEEEQVREDLETWLNVMKTGDHIWVHDYLPMPGAKETYPGVKRVCDDLVSKGCLEQIPTTGIGFTGRVI